MSKPCWRCALAVPIGNMTITGVASKSRQRNQGFARGASLLFTPVSAPPTIRILVVIPDRPLD
jgi:hypothetical protein